MAWSTSRRRDDLPIDWQRLLRPAVLERDGHRCCYLDAYGVRCAEKATEVDHVRRGSDHRMSNLRSLCRWHHAQKSAREGAQEAARNRKRQATKFLRKEQHPGLT